MLTLSNNTRRTVFAAVLGTAQVGSAAVSLTPFTAHAQQWRDDRFRGDGDDPGYRADMDDRSHRGDMDDRRYGGDWDERYSVGVGGVYGYPGYYPYYSGYYDPYAYAYGYENGPYCPSYDYYNGYCSF